MSSDSSPGADLTITCPKSGEVILVVNQWSRFLTEFEEIKCIGSGGFGMVTLCKSKVDNVKYAIKKVPIGLEEEYIGLEDESTGLLTKKGPDCDYATLVREVRVLAQMDHPNIIRYYSAWVDPSFEGLDNDNSVDHESDNSEGYRERAKNSKCPCLYIQVQLCNESLKDILKSSNRKDSFHIFDQILDGIIYMHDRQIVHMDLTPDNIFMDKKGRIRIGDFGLARSVGESTSRLGGKFLYQPMEKDVVCTKYDMYFIGVMLFEWLSTFQTGSERCIILNNLKNGGKDLEDEVEKVDANDLTKKVLTQLLDQNPEMRPSASELKNNLGGMLDN